MPRHRQRSTVSRRSFASTAATGFSAAMVPGIAAAARDDAFSFRYAVASCMYGYESVETILKQVPKCGARAIDIWPKVHGNQREQLDELGEARFEELLRQHDVALSCITQYKLGPFGIDNEIRLAARLGCRTIVTGGKGPKNLSGDKLRAAIRQFVAKLGPTLRIARDNGVKIAIENHANNLIHDADSLRYLRDLAPADVIRVAFAPYHLPQNPEFLAALIRDLGPSIEVFYAWQHGMGCMKKLPKEQELLQMPGRGDLDFGPIVAALAEIDFQGWTEIFMHPVPRGVPILETPQAVTAEINRARSYLEAQRPA